MADIPEVLPAIEPVKPLTARQAAFVREYLVDRNGRQAAIRAGYAESGASVEGTRLLRNANVAAALAQAQHELARRVGLSAEMVVGELRKLGFANMLDYLAVGENGEAIIDLSAITPDQAAAIVEYTVEEYKEGSGKDARDIKRTKIKLADKRAALVDLGKHIGIFRENATQQAIVINLSKDDGLL